MPCLLTYSISGRKTPYGEISSALSSPPSCTRIVVSEDYDRQTSLAYINQFIAFQNSLCLYTFFLSSCCAAVGLVVDKGALRSVFLRTYTITLHIKVMLI